MGVKFTNPDVADKFEATRKSDCKVHIPAGKEKKGGYAGMLSDITPEAAEKAVKSGSGNIKLKSGSPGNAPSGDNNVSGE
jgi:hypothetical protein